MDKPYIVYILECRDGSLYTGITNDLVRRLKAHQNGTAAKYTRSRRPVKLVYMESCKTKGDALRREYAIKAMRRKEKQMLIMKGGADAGTNKL
ncbi:GIY-YIG nuclease family protein [Tuberibacillus calidus]|jgi:putative endonuclease|uniref:GIY-YIG nuclease family protein n=1 Tax=Tuberibacillus calidus TaxID=340097 RepID=UPI00040AFC98|nr:GIY-YIG nuclease family protein [Tuberibacillus calidus]